jgi:hypothetical protein
MIADRQRLTRGEGRRVDRKSEATKRAARWGATCETPRCADAGAARVATIRSAPPQLAASQARSSSQARAATRSTREMIVVISRNSSHSMSTVQGSIRVPGEKGEDWLCRERDRVGVIIAFVRLPVPRALQRYGGVRRCRGSSVENAAYKGVGGHHLASHTTPVGSPSPLIEITSVLLPVSLRLVCA